MAMTSSFSSVRMFYNIIIHVRRSTSIYFSSLRPPPHHSQTSLPPSLLNTAVTFFLLLDNRYHECLQVNAYNMTHSNIGKYLSPISNETKIGTYIYPAVWYNIIKYRYYCSQNLFHPHRPFTRGCILHGHSNFEQQEDYGNHKIALSRSVWREHWTVFFTSLSPATRAQYAPLLIHLYYYYVVAFIYYNIVWQRSSTQ